VPFCSTCHLLSRRKKSPTKEPSIKSSLEESRRSGRCPLLRADSDTRAYLVGEPLMNSSPRMNVASLAAIDVHVHLEAGQRRHCDGRRRDTDQFEFRSTRRKKCSNVSHRSLAESGCIRD
jgi:hypothetical protein